MPSEPDLSHAFIIFIKSITYAEVRFEKVFASV